MADRARRLADKTRKVLWSNMGASVKVAAGKQLSGDRRKAVAL